MKLINFVGVIGSCLFLLKIAIHIYIKRKIDKKFYVGPSGHFLNPVLFLPIFDSLPGELNKLKKAGNLIYLSSIVLILIYVIGVNVN